MWASRGRGTRGAVAPALFAAALVTSCAVPADPGEEGRHTPAPADPAELVVGTRLSIDGHRFRINGAITYPRQPAEGMLMNVRMVNSVFEDTKRPSFDPSANTTEFVGRMREYVSLGVRAFTV